MIELYTQTFKQRNSPATKYQTRWSLFLLSICWVLLPFDKPCGTFNVSNFYHVITNCSTNTGRKRKTSEILSTCRWNVDVLSIRQNVLWAQVSSYTCDSIVFFPALSRSLSTLDFLSSIYGSKFGVYSYWLLEIISEQIWSLTSWIYNIRDSETV